MTVPVLRPLLPNADRLLPYLRRIDASRIYSNWGPLTSELEQRLENGFAMARGTVVSASSGTAALVGAILAAAGRARADRPLAIMPAFTFIATAAAVEQCGYRPFLVDIDPTDWMLRPERLLALPQLSEAGVVIPVAPFGRAVPQAPWLAFRKSADVAVVIDGAASFEALERDPRGTLGEVPVCLSFHATKSFAIGEGGCVIATVPDLISKTTRALNFGFLEARDSRAASINGKLSEYHAAVGLAELDGWAEKKRAFAAVAATFRKCFDAAGLGDRWVGAPDVASCYALFVCAGSAEAEAIVASLGRAQIDYRLWYGLGLQQQGYLRTAPRDDLTVTQQLAPRILGLPMAVDLPASVIDRIVAAVTEAVAGCPGAAR